ncbi:unnamed protein product [Alternaria alternata]
MQLEACRIIIACEHKGGEDISTSALTKGDSWLRDLIMSSEDVIKEARSGSMELSNDGEISFLKIHGQHYLFEKCQFESQLRIFVEFERLMDVHVHDVHIQNEACEIIRRKEEDSLTSSESFTSWIITLVRSNADWLSKFKERNGISAKDVTNHLVSGLSLGSGSSESFPWLPPCSPSPPVFLSTEYEVDPSAVDLIQADHMPAVSAPLTEASELQGLANYHIEDANFYRGFVANLKRWVAATMCTENPNSHVPSDAEIQHQARWLLYNGGDAWNQTPADFVEWLEPFKRQEKRQIGRKPPKKENRECGSNSRQEDACRNVPAVHDSTHDYATKDSGHIDHDEGQGSHRARCAESSSVGGEVDRGDEIAEALKNVAELKK